MINFATTIFMIFIPFGTINPKDRKPKSFLRGEDATVHIDLLETMGKDVLEITFSDFTSKPLLQNVMIVDLQKNQTDNIYIMRTYAGRIERIEKNNGSLSFLLLNVNVIDSGHYMAYEDSVLKGNTSILVARHRLLVQNGFSITLPFLCNVTNVTSIKIELMVNTLQFVVVKYDVTQANCTEVGNLYMDRIDSCALRGSTFSLTLRKVSYIDVGIYVAWDDMDFLIDSVCVAVEEISATSSPESTRIYVNSPFIPNIPSPENYQFEWILVSGLIVVLVVTGMVINFVGRLRERKVSKTTMYTPTQRNILQSRANSSRHCIQNVEIAHTLEGTRIVLTENKPTDDRSSLAHNGSQENASLNGTHLCSRVVDSAKSTVRNNQIDPILVSVCENIQSEPTKEDKHVHEYDELEPECQFNGVFLHSKISCNNPSKDTVEYDNMPQHSYTILRPLASIPVVTRKTREQVTIADSFAWNRKGNKESSSIFSSSAVCVNVSTESINDVDCTGSRTEIGNRDFRYEASHSSWFEFENSSSGYTVHSSNSSQESYKKRDYQSLKYATNVPRPESSEFQADTKSPSVSLTMSYDVAGNDLANLSARKTGPQTSQSCGALYGNMRASDGGRRVELRL